MDENIEELIKGKIEKRQRESVNYKHIPLKSLLEEVFLESILREDTADDKVLQLKNTFNMLDKDADGKIEAAELARVVKEVLGREVDLNTAQSLVNEWDRDNDEGLSYDEFVQMLLSDQEEDRAKT